MCDRVDQIPYYFHTIGIKLINPIQSFFFHTPFSGFQSWKGGMSSYPRELIDPCVPCGWLWYSSWWLQENAFLASDSSTVQGFFNANLHPLEDFHGGSGSFTYKSHPWKDGGNPIFQPKNLHEDMFPPPLINLQGCNVTMDIFSWLKSWKKNLAQNHGLGKATHLKDRSVFWYLW